MTQQSERGAAAVEFAIVLPLLLTLLLGIVEFSRAFNAQVTLTSAAREGVRVMAITNKPADAKTAAQKAAASLGSIPTSDITMSTNSCASPAQVTLTIKFKLTTATGIAGPFNMHGKAVMLCGG